MTAGRAAALEYSCPDDRNGNSQTCLVVRVVGAGVTTRTVTIGFATLLDDHDISNAQYQVRGPGPSPQPGPITGLSIRGVIAHVGGFAPTQVRYATIADQFTTSFLTNDDQGDDFASPSPFAGDPPLQPVFYQNGKDVAYLRPLRPDTDDLNSADNQQTGDQPYLVVTLHLTGTVLTPRISPGTSTIRAGRSITFSATLPTAVVGAKYTWNYGDGSPPDSTDGPQSPPHDYRTVSGTAGYYAFVDVTGADGSAGRSNPAARVVVTGAKPIETPPGGPSGSDHGGGGSTNPTSGPAAGSGAQLGGVPDAGNRPPGTGPTDATSGAVAPVPGAATGTGHVATASATRSGSSAPAADGSQIVGYLLAGPQGAAQPTASTAARRPGDAAAARNERPVTHVPGWVLGVAGILVLLVLGAAGEYRRPSRAPKRRA